MWDQRWEPSLLDAGESPPAQRRPSPPQAASSTPVLTFARLQVNDSVLTDVQGGQIASASDISPAYPSQRSISLPAGKERRLHLHFYQLELPTSLRLPEAICVLLTNPIQNMQMKETTEAARASVAVGGLVCCL